MIEAEKLFKKVFLESFFGSGKLPLFICLGKLIDAEMQKH
jgi:hypothetical protein